MVVKVSQEDANLIVCAWKKIPMSTFDLGEKIMYKLFEKYPINQAEFTRFKDVPLDDLMGRPSFRVHACRLINRFDATIDCLQLLEGTEDAEFIDEVFGEIEGIWLEIGKNHAKKRITRRSFLQLRDVMVIVLSESCDFSELQLAAWSRLFDQVYTWMFNILGDSAKGDN